MPPTPSVDRQLVALRSEQASLRRPIEDRVRASKLASLAPARADGLSRRGEIARKARRTEMQKTLVAEFARVNTVTPDEIDRSLDARTKARRLELAPPHRRARKSPQELRHDPGVVGRGAGSADLHLRRGDFRNPGPQIEPGVIAVLDDPAHPFQLPAAGQHGSTGYRTAFAKWLTSDRHPLTARVYVNRLWMHHFGRGIVPTPDNFGASGLPPSHPELLDWLAREFIASGWDVKHVQRLIVKSAAYRQASTARRIASGPRPREHAPKSIRRTFCCGRCRSSGTNRRSSATRFSRPAAHSTCGWKGSPSR